ncbi:MAG: HAD-IA family hydrolase [Deltaproteobacteria bacterium]|nr:HAD-IA family hydrolase [Deltaproteobacteria bacterium]
MKSIDTIIFDLDGTLVDSIADIALAVNLMRKGLGLLPLPETEVISYVGDGSKKLVERSLRGESTKFVEGLKLFMKYYREHFLDQTRLMPGVVETLERFSDKNLALVTNKMVAFTEEILNGLKIRDYFGLILGGDSTEKIKPDPEPILQVLEYFRTPSKRAVMIGDHYTDLKAGKAAGVWTCFVDGFGRMGDVLPDISIENLFQLQAHIR